MSPAESILTVTLTGSALVVILVARDAVRIHRREKEISRRLERREKNRS